jgi:hypothetical protein
MIEHGLYTRSIQYFPRGLEGNQEILVWIAEVLTWGLPNRNQKCNPLGHNVLFAVLV